MKKENKKETLISVIILILVLLILGYVAFNKGGLPFLGGGSQNDGGVKVTTIEAGQGARVKEGDMIAITYVGSFENGEIFESNVGEEPYVLTLGSTPVIRGWGMGVKGMKVGEKRRIVINPEYAYGEKGVPGVVPPYAKLVYEVDLIAIKN